MERVEKAYAKLNICLAVGDCMENGYHEVNTVMQSISLCDELKINVSEAFGEVSLVTDMPFLPTDDRNLAVRAAKLFYRRLGMIRRETHIEIKKRIPVGAGLAGGSSDVAAVLRAMNSMFGTELSKEQLEEMGAELGSDVPYCIAGGTVFASGRGEILHPMAQLPKAYVVVCKPAFAISTPELFHQFDLVKPKSSPDVDEVIDAIEKNDSKRLGRVMYNVFEDVLPPRYEEIGQIKNRLLDYEPYGTSMTGTGSAVYALFESQSSAAAAYEALKADYDDCFLCETTPAIEF